MRVNLYPPAVIRIRKDSGGFGYARGPYVSLPVDHSAHQLPHELHHVKQWWMVTLLSAVALYALQYYVAFLPLEVIGLSVGVMGMLTRLSKTFRFATEASAYRVSTKVSPDRIDQFAKMLYDYNTGRTLEQCRAALGLDRD